MCAYSATRSLPHYGSPLVGREAETSYLLDLIGDPAVHLVTVTGSAGIGKTRLTTYVCGEQSDQDALFIPMAAIRDPSLVPVEIGKALEIPGDDLISMIRVRLEEWRGLILLDNMEQVIQAASAIAEMIPPNPELTVLVTSQRPLQIEGERVVRLSPLPIPDFDMDARDLLSTASVQLLVNRATAQDSSFPESLQEPSTSDAIAKICRRLDGIPLALELAASRLSSLSPEVVMTQLERDQNILSTQRRDTPERQRTMHSAIAWSYDLLPQEMQQVFLWLGTFSSGFDLTIVERVSTELGATIASFDIVSELMNLSLIQRTSGGANPWYQMLESIRSFCLATLNELGNRRAAEAYVGDYVFDLAVQSREEFSGPNIGEWMARLARERATIRGAVHWGLEHEDPRVPMAVGARIFPFFEQEGAWREVVDWIDTAMQWHEKLPAEEVINALISKISMHEKAHDLENAASTDAIVHDMLRRNDSPILEMRYLVTTCNIAIDKKQWDIAESRFQRVLELGKQEDYKPATSTALANLGNIAHHRGDAESAKAFLLEALDIFNEQGNVHNAAQAIANLGAVHVSQGNYSEALSYFEQAASLTDEPGLRYPRIYNLLGIASVNHGLGEFDAADAAAREAISEAQDMEYHQLEVIGYIRLATSALYREDVQGIYTNTHTALAIQVNANGSQEYVQLGALVAGALELQGRDNDAVPILGKSLAWGNAIEYSPYLQVQKVLEAMQDRLRGSVPDYDRLIQTGEEWSEQSFIKVLTRTSQKHSSKPGTLLVTIPERTTGPLDHLTLRENEILDLLINGESTQGMADRLSLSPRTVTTHIGNMMSKLGVSSRTELVAKALRNQVSSHN